MHIAALIARYLMGAMFAFFGLNGFAKFWKQPPPPSRLGQAFMETLQLPSYTVMVFGCQLICGVLLLSGFFIPLALTVLAGILLNIFVFHLAFEPKSLPIALVSWILWIVVFIQYQASFAALFASRA